jgi:site-specific DNA-methyltransferase (adenine-specific)
MELNKIYCENCLDTMSRMPDNFIDLTVTSPPYDNLRNYNGYSFDFEAISLELFRVTKIGGVVVWVVGDETIDGSETGKSFIQALQFKNVCGFNLHDTMIYSKAGFAFPSNDRYHQTFEFMFVLSKGKLNTFNPIKDRRNNYDVRGGDCSRQKNGTMKKGNKGGLPLDKFGQRYNVWHYKIGGGNVTNDKYAYKHPAIFPEQLCADHIYSWSNEGDLIYDPFMGSGTTAKMAHLQKRNWIGSEISQEYVDLANKRIDPYLKQLTIF